MRIKNPDPASVIAVVGVIFSLIFVLPYLDAIFSVLINTYDLVIALFWMVPIVLVILLKAGVFNFLLNKKP